MQSNNSGASTAFLFWLYAPEVLLHLYLLHLVLFVLNQIGNPGGSWHGHKKTCVGTDHYKDSVMSNKNVVFWLILIANTSVIVLK